MQYYCIKTGMEMFDVCRAYGFGLILDTLKEEGEEAIIISDLGIYYLIKGPTINKPDVNRLYSLFDFDLLWKETYLTLQRSRRSELKLTTKSKIEEVKEVVFSRIKQILKIYSKPTPIKIPDLKGETLYQSMDLAATKGYRVPVRNKVSYTEGSSLKVPLEHWALASLGEAHFSVWKFSEALIPIVPQPQNVKVMNWRNIRNRIAENGKNLSRVSISATLAHIATLLAKELRQGKINGDPFIDRFSSLIYGAMKGTAGQWKPASGGLFPLEFLYSLIDSNLEVSGDIFEIWDNVFQIGNRKGCEDIALSLCEFITHPNLDNWEKYQRVHLRYLLRENMPIRAYSEECIMEVVKNARS